MNITVCLGMIRLFEIVFHIKVLVIVITPILSAEYAQKKPEDPIVNISINLLTYHRTEHWYFCSALRTEQPAVLCRKASKWRLPRCLEESEYLFYITIREKCYVLLLAG